MPPRKKAPARATRAAGAPATRDRSESHATAPDVEVKVETADLARVRSDLVVVGAFEDADAFHGVTGAVDDATGGMLARALRLGDFSGKLKQTTLVHPDGASMKRVLLVGLGDVKKFNADRARRVAAVAARRARDLHAASAHFALFGVGSPGCEMDPRLAAEAMAEGALLGLYEFNPYKGSSKENDEEKGAKKKPKLARIVLVDKDATHARAAREGAQTGVVIAHATNLCRDWAQWSSQEAAPARYGERAKALAREHKLTAHVMDKREIERLGMGGLLAVSEGSAREPRFVVLEHKPARAGARTPTVVLVGKGITFDSGGISIKPSDGMEKMKMDKCGASAVVGAVVAASRLALPIHVVAIAAFTDNLPSGTAYKPGDVVTTMSGKTIEIINTDAEGRVILSDALYYGSSRYEPAAMVELSTLTGGCVVAVGHHAIAGMGNSDALLNQLVQAGNNVNERVWPMPFFDEYGEMVKSKVADVLNSAGRVASSITAGKFLETFVGDHPWVHLDIASTAYHGGGSPKLNEEFSPGEATGIGVRLLVEWLRHFEAPKWEKEAKLPRQAASDKSRSATRRKAQR